MSSQELNESWEEVKQIWNDSSKGTKIEFHIANLIDELKQKTTEFEKSSIKSDLTHLKASWKRYNKKVSQFEKDAVTDDVSMITKWIKRFFRKFIK